ncbi:hypothetical protein GN956_G24376 [Arapaima gigas]
MAFGGSLWLLWLVVSVCHVGAQKGSFVSVRDATYGVLPSISGSYQSGPSNCLIEPSRFAQHGMQSPQDGYGGLGVAQTVDPQVGFSPAQSSTGYRGDQGSAGQHPDTACQLGVPGHTAGPHVAMVLAMLCSLREDGMTSSRRGSLAQTFGFHGGAASQGAHGPRGLASALGFPMPQSLPEVFMAVFQANEGLEEIASFMHLHPVV